jgi:archaellum component FlaC
MLYTVVLVLVLMLLAGVIAYAGDVLGTAVGRRRLTLFGWRPRRTGQMVGIAVGILIMLTTLAVLALAFRGAASVIVNAQRAAEELNALQRQLRESQAELRQARETVALAEYQRAAAERQRDQASLERDALRAETGQLQQEVEQLGASVTQVTREVEAATSQLRTVQLQLEQALAARDEAINQVLELRQTTEGLSTQLLATQADLSNLRLQTENVQRQNELLTARNETLQATNQQLRSDNEREQENVQRLAALVGVYQDQMDALRQELELASRELMQQRERAAQVEAGNLTYRRGEIVHAGVINAQELPAIREELIVLVEVANGAVARRGGGPVTLSTEQVNGLIQAAYESPGEDLVVLLARSDQFASSRVEVMVEARENHRLLKAGQLVVSRQLHLGSAELPISQSELRLELTRLLAEATNRLQRLGLFEQVRPDISASVLESFTASLLRLEGSAVIGLVSQAPVNVIGPVEMKFVILR